MATEAQNKYIVDLAVLKTKEFKEVKELLVANGIVKPTSKTVMDAQTLAAINDALTEEQASKFIDILVAMKQPKRDKVYSETRINRAIGALEDIKNSIDRWDFPS